MRVIAPSRSLTMISQDTRRIADERLDELGLTVSFGEHVLDTDDFTSSSIGSRVEDLHDAFADDRVDAILTVIGGFNSHQLLPYLDFDLIGSRPKILCGYSDITALQNAIFARTGLVTYSGLHYSTFGMRDHFDDNLRWFVECLFSDDEMHVAPAATWSDDEWFLDQDDRDIRTNEGWWSLNDGAGAGTLIGGNASTVQLLNGTAWSPPLAGSVLFLEDDAEAQPHGFDRWLTAMLQQPGAAEIAGLVIGRFQLGSNMTRRHLGQIVGRHAVLDDVPVLANVDFGHTNPMLTFPIGGHVAVTVDGDRATLTIARH
ncbi:MAG: LD-carboxypeptidase [Nitriliruptoraceae bacterium]